MQVFWTIVLFILGSIFGSFLNVCIYRLPRDKSPWNPSRSYCPQCHEMIAWYDNIPLVSWFVLRAQCRHCGSYISPRYAVVEFLTAFVFAVTYWVLSSRGEPTPVIVVYLGLMCLLILSSFIDIELRIIPNEITLGGAALAPVFSVFIPELHANDALARCYVFNPASNFWGPLWACLVGMAVGALVTWGSGVVGKVLFRREAMGFGDVKFMALIGGFLGWLPVLIIFFLAALLGAVAGVAHLLRTREHHIPYGPFLSIAAAIVMLWGDKVLALLKLTQTGGN